MIDVETRKLSQSNCRQARKEKMAENENQVRTKVTIELITQLHLHHKWLKTRYTEN